LAGAGDGPACAFLVQVDRPSSLRSGAHFDQGVSCAEIESAKVVSPAIIPLSGTVVAVNEALNDAPELVNSDPYGDGWLARITADDASEETIPAAEYARLVSA